MIETTASKSFTARRPSHDEAKDGTTPAPRRPRVAIFTWLNLVCLDAPIVAVAWEWLFARSFGITPAKGATLALFLTAWLIYLADRLGDSLTVDSLGATSLRQRVCLRWRAAWIVGLVLVALGDLFVVRTQLDWRVRSFAIPLSLIALTYLILNQRTPALWRLVPMKELSIGFLFAAGTVVPLEPRLTTATFLPWILFAALCSLNCICIAVWERGLDVAQRRISLATVFPGIGHAILPSLGAVGLTSLALACSRSDGWIIYPCLGLSAAFLALVYFCRARIQADSRTALADLILLTPLSVFVGVVLFR